VSQLNYSALYNRYKKSLELEGEDYFTTNILTCLRDEELNGAVVSTGVMDENTSIRRSAVPVELRISAAEGALLDFRNGTLNYTGGIKSININRGNDHIDL
tara:strand:- start:80 stop:382 length:303 start_codon:yes stop_codon:yes gene_type:complete